MLAVIASVVVGLAGALALASPASAHHSEVSGTYVCDEQTGEWVVTWTVQGVAPDRALGFKLVTVTVAPLGSLVPGIAVTEGDNYPHTSGVPLVGEQRLPADADGASISVRAKWEGTHFEESRPRTHSLDFQGTCEQVPDPEPVQVIPASDCDELAVTVDNPQDGAPIDVVITTSTGQEESFSLEAPGSETRTFDAEEDLTYEVLVNGVSFETGEWQDQGACNEVEVPIAWKPDCESLTIEVTNPLEDQGIEAVISSGDITETLVVEPGDVAEVTLDAEAGTFATVTVGDEPLEIAWEQPKDEDCDSGAGGGLPETGAPTGLVVGAALALLALGGGLFVIARRRRVTFTA